MYHENTAYLDMVSAKRDYATLDSFHYLDAMFPGFHSSDIYRANAPEEQRGSLSWGASLVGRSYLRIYEVTGDDRYLRGFVGIGEQMLLARDSVRGVKDYLGRTGPVWRSGRPYTTNSIALSCGAVEGPCLEIRSKQATRIRIENLRLGTKAVDISFFADTDGTTLASFSDVSMSSNEERSISEVLAKQQWKSPQAAAAISHDGCTDCFPPDGVYELGEEYYAPAVHVSQICVSLLEFSELVRGDQSLSAKYGEYAEKYTQAAEEALTFYEPDYRVSEHGGYYEIAADAPNDFEGTDAPQNHNMSMALCFLLLHKVTGQSSYLTRATELLTTFRSTSFEAKIGSRKCLMWSYFTPTLTNYLGHQGGNHSRWRSFRKGNTRMDDMSHAVLSVEAAIEAHKLGVVISAEDLESMANTFVAAATSGSLGNYMDGTAGIGKYDDVAGRWAILSPWHNQIGAVAADIMQAAQPQPGHASVLLACANLIGARVKSRSFSADYGPGGDRMVGSS
jgi:hypothetical protein